MVLKLSNCLVMLLLVVVTLHAQFDKHTDKPKIAAVPIITYNKSYGGIFGGFGALYFPINKGEPINDFLPCVGAGIRHMMIPDIGINIGFDAAVGKDDYGLYFRIGEAF